MKRLPLPPLDLLNHLLQVDSTSPSGLRWKNPRCTRCKPGQVAGNNGHREGRWRVSIKTDKDREYLAYRIVDYMLTGIDPGDLDVDHASRDTKNNIDVRKATHSQNGANSNPKSHYRGRPTSSKYKGVMWNKRNKKWTATLTVNYKKHHLGYFSNELDAAKAYDQAALKFSGEFAALNRDLFPDDFL